MGPIPAHTLDSGPSKNRLNYLDPANERQEEETEKDQAPDLSPMQGAGGEGPRGSKNAPLLWSVPGNPALHRAPL